MKSFGFEIAGAYLSSWNAEALHTKLGAQAFRPLDLLHLPLRPGFPARFMAGWRNHL